MSTDKKVRVRIAPSPTGPFHIGTARTALFNWLFAKSKGGEFIVRIEDTDKVRSDKKYEDGILEGLKWLGLDWDELYRQSDRGDIYKGYLDKLIAEGKAYYCFCSKEDLEERRQAMLVQGLAPKYSGQCRDLPEAEVKKRIVDEPYVIRLKVPDTKVSFKDIIRGKIEFDGALMGDIIIAREGGDPLYNFVVTIDDVFSGITHVIRGEDHISNTPQQIFVMQALNFDIPEFAHLPMILNADKSKMSKRKGDVVFTDYIQQGYVKEAMVNFLAFMGWHPKDDREILNIEELIKEFDLVRVQKGGAIFNREKLDWFNNHYLKEMDSKELLALAQEFVPKGWELNEAIIDSVRGRINHLDELSGLIGFYFELPDYQNKILKWQDMNFGAVELNLNKVKDILTSMDSADFYKTKLEEAISRLVVNGNKGEMFWPLRVALSGKERSPGPFEIMEGLGKKESINRINIALEKLELPEVH